MSKNEVIDTQLFLSRWQRDTVFGDEQVARTVESGST